MKYLPKIYARAFAEAAIRKMSAAEESKVVGNFLKLIRKNGDTAQIKKIFAETEKILRLKNGKRKIILETARPLKRTSKEILGNFARAGDIIEKKISPHLVAGLKIIVNEENQFDGSLKRKIEKMFLI